MATLEVKNLKKNFGKVKVLKDISFELQEGQVLTILGSSGGGKTTLLRCLNFFGHCRCRRDLGRRQTTAHLF